MSSSSLERVRHALAAVIRGKQTAIELLLTGVLSGGHVLLEDVPGVGKTTLAKALARAFGLAFARIQFTPDMLPADILGSSVLDPRDGSFTFHPGPVFTGLLLADEINRASPRTQSALLEAMNEGQVTIDGTTRRLDQPFFVVATQNPVDYQGTYPLPEAQLDRFAIRLELGYPAAEEELQVLFDRRAADPLDDVEEVITTEELLALQREVREVTVGEEVGRYLLSLVRATREHAELELGASTRGALALFAAARARAMIGGRDWVGPADVQALAGPVLAHRLLLSAQARYAGQTTARIVAEIVDRAEVPL